MCNCGKSKISNVGSNSVTPTVQTCQYTEEQLNNLLLVAEPTEVPLVQSQLNLYSSNCNMYFNLIQPLLTKYSI